VKQNFHYLKAIVDFGLCFKRNIKDVIMDKVHFDEDDNVNVKARCILKGM
jgi:hypothetical protein